MKLTLSLGDEYEKLEMKQAILTSINHYKKENLFKGIRLGKYAIFIPILLKLTLSLGDEYEKLEMKQAILTSINH
ncbi:hypothetical protein EDM29_15815, partial [Staphylococcus aureus]